MCLRVVIHMDSICSHDGPISDRQGQTHMRDIWSWWANEVQMDPKCQPITNSDTAAGSVFSICFSVDGSLKIFF